MHTANGTTTGRPCCLARLPACLLVHLHTCLPITCRQWSFEHLRALDNGRKEEEKKLCRPISRPLIDHSRISAHSSRAGNSIHKQVGAVKLFLAGPEIETVRARANLSADNNNTFAATTAAVASGQRLMRADDGGGRKLDLKADDLGCRSIVVVVVVKRQRDAGVPKARCQQSVVRSLSDHKLG